FRARGFANASLGPPTRIARTGRPLAMPRSLNLKEDLYRYVMERTVREHPVLAELREATAGMKHGGMQIGPDQGQFMQLLVRMLGAKRTIEVGVFTGYSSLAVALALPADGKIVAW